MSALTFTSHFQSGLYVGNKVSCCAGVPVHAPAIAPALAKAASAAVAPAVGRSFGASIAGQSGVCRIPLNGGTLISCAFCSCVVQEVDVDVDTP